MIMHSLRILLLILYPIFIGALQIPNHVLVDSPSLSPTDLMTLQSREFYNILPASHDVGDDGGDDPSSHSESGDGLDGGLFPSEGTQSMPITIGGTSRTASTYSNGGGKVITIPVGQAFAGRQAGGGTRDQIYGTRWVLVLVSR
ncbi:hypothetical protein BDQ17DRAFT_831414 [Cyathus striatus]|nr:hypothetical protein BDQ17DRAFT_831414 [Cyathus striatus]